MSKLDRDTEGKFTKGNSGGRGGKRPGAGRPPKPKDSLIKQLYSLLEKSAPLALDKLKEQINHSDPKVAQGACKIILSKMLPERSAHENWKVNPINEPEELAELSEFLKWKMEKATEEAEDLQEKEANLKLVKGDKK